MATGWNKEETMRKRMSQEAIVTAGGSGLVSRTKIAYGDFLKKPQAIATIIQPLVKHFGI